MHCRLEFVLILTLICTSTLSTSTLSTSSPPQQIQHFGQSDFFQLPNPSLSQKLQPRLAPQPTLRTSIPIKNIKEHNKNVEHNQDIMGIELVTKCRLHGQYLLNNVECVEKCPLSWFANQDLGICSACRDYCLECNIFSECLECKQGYMLIDQNKSQQQTQTSRKNKQKACVLVEQLENVRFSQNQVDRMMRLRRSRLLQVCPAICTSCSTGTTVCLGCTPGYVLYLGVCQTTVPTGHLNISGIAQPCTSPCSQCVGTLTNCTACVVEYYLFAANHTCLHLQCPTYYFEEQVGRVCTACVSPCLDCMSETACVTCATGSIYYFFNQTYECVSVCPFAFYQSSATQQCQSCQSPCEDCSTLLSCNTCLDGFYLIFNGDQCVIQCPYGYIQNDIANQCKACTSPCQSCQDTATTCYSCVANTYLFENKCETACPLGYVTNHVSRVCEECPLPCMNCVETNCYQCQSPYILDTAAHACVNSCPAGTFPIINIILDPTTDNLECASCDSACARCSSQFFCTECASGYYWLLSTSMGSCVTVCPVDTAPILNIALGMCVSCSDSECKLCDENDYCSDCSSSTLLYQGLCLTECPAGYVPDSTDNFCEVYVAAYVYRVELIELLPLLIGLIGTVHVLGLMLARKLVKYTLGRTAIVVALLAASWGIPASMSLARAIYTEQDYFDNLSAEQSSRRFLQNDNNSSGSSTAIDPHLFLYILYAAAGCLICLNIGVVIWAGMKILNPKQDPTYATWRSQSTIWEKIMIYFVQMLTFMNFNSQNILWSKLRCAPKLECIEKLHYMRVASLLGLIPETLTLCSIIPMMAFVKQLRLSFIDVIITTVLAAIFSLLALRRQADFFQEQIYIDPDTIKNRFRDKHEYDGKTAEKHKFHAIYETKSNMDTPFNIESSQRDFYSQSNHSHYKKQQVVPAKRTEGSYYGVSSGSLTSNEDQLGIDCFLRDQAHNRRKMAIQDEEERKKKDLEKYYKNKEPVFYSEEIQSDSNYGLINKNATSSIKSASGSGSGSGGEDQKNSGSASEAIVIDYADQTEGNNGEEEGEEGYENAEVNAFIRSASPVKVGNSPRKGIGSPQRDSDHPDNKLQSASGSVVKVSMASPEFMQEVRISKEEYDKLVFKQRLWNLNKPYDELLQADFQLIRQRFWNTGSVVQDKQKDKWQQRKWNQKIVDKPSQEQQSMLDSEPSQIQQKAWNFKTVKKPNVNLPEEKQSSYIETEDLNKPTKEIQFEDGIDPAKSKYMEKQSKLWMNKQQGFYQEDQDDQCRGQGPYQQQQMQQRSEWQHIHRQGDDSFVKPKKQIYKKVEEKELKNQVLAQSIEIQKLDTGTFFIENSKKNEQNQKKKGAKEGEYQEQQEKQALDEEQIEHEESSQSAEYQQEDYYLHAEDSDEQGENSDSSGEQENLENQKLMVQMEEKGEYIDFVGKELMEVQEIAAALKRLKLKRKKMRRRKSRSMSKKKKTQVTSASKHPYKFRQLSAKKLQQPRKLKKLKKTEEPDNTGRVYVINFEDYQKLRQKAKAIKEGRNPIISAKKTKNFRMKLTSKSQKQRTQKSESNLTNANTFKYRLANSQSELKSLSRDPFHRQQTRQNTRRLHDSSEKNSQILRPVFSAAVPRNGSSSLTKIKSVYNNPVKRKL